jgi:autotransporter-associated beta strand protein
LCLAAAATLLASSSRQTFAADTWTNATANRLWSVGNNWADFSEPLGSDDVTFPNPVPVPANSDTLFLSAGETARSLIFNAPYTLLPDAANSSLFLTNGTIQVAAGQTADIEVNLSGGAGVQVQGFGTGKLIMGANNTYTGTTSVVAGTLQLGNGGPSGNLGGGNVIVVGTGTLAFNSSANTAFLGAISGAGTINKLGTNLLAFYGNNTHTGLTTIAAGGTIQVGDGTTNGSIVGNVVTDGTLAFNRSDAVTYGGTITGTGSVNKMAANTLTFTGNHGYTGGTTIAVDGTLQLGNGGTSGQITGNVTNSGTITFNRSDDVFFGGVMSGNGKLNKLGAGVLTLGGNSTAVSQVTISAGTLQLGAGETAGSLGANVINNGTLGFFRSDDVTFAGVVSGTGALLKRGDNTLTLSADHSYTGLTTVDGGTLRIGTGGFGGALASNVLNQGTLVFDHAGTKTYANAISGIGNVVKSGAGVLVLTGTNIYFGGTTISPGGGFLQVGAGGTTGSIAGDVTNSGQIIFNRSDDLTYAGTISGTGGMQKSGAGRLVLTADHTYTGNTGIDAGATLQLGNGGAGGGGALAAGNQVFNNGTLVFNHADDITFDGNISGPGAVVKHASNTLTFPFDYSYGGTTTINAGTLRLGTGGPQGFVSGNIVNATGATVVFNHNINRTYAGVISGGGGVDNLGTNLLILSGNNTYTGPTTIAVGGTLRLGNGGTSGSITGAGGVANNGTLSFNRTDSLTFAGDISGSGVVSTFGGVALTLAGNNTYTGGTFVSGGSITFTKPHTTGSVLSVSNGGVARLAHAAATPNNVVLRTGLFNPNVNGRLDVVDNKVIVTGGGSGGVGTATDGVYTGLSRFIQTAYNAGNWDGPVGIFSSLPDAAAGLTSIGICTADQTGFAGGTFGGVSVSGSDVLIMYTYAGDVNLDGFISGDDYSAIDFNIAKPGASGWANGDFNYDGIISGDDYTVIDFNIVAQGAPFPTGATSSSSTFAVAVPEPAIGTVLLGAVSVPLGRRGRRRR